VFLPARSTVRPPVTPIRSATIVKVQSGRVDRVTGKELFRPSELLALAAGAGQLPNRLRYLLAACLLRLVLRQCGFVPLISELEHPPNEAWSIPDEALATRAHHRVKEWHGLSTAHHPGRRRYEHPPGSTQFTLDFLSIRGNNIRYIYPTWTTCAGDTCSLTDTPKIIEEEGRLRDRRTVADRGGGRATRSRALEVRRAGRWRRRPQGGQWVFIATSTPMMVPWTNRAILQLDGDALVRELHQESDQPSLEAAGELKYSDISGHESGIAVIQRATGASKYRQSVAACPAPQPVPATRWLETAPLPYRSDSPPNCTFTMIVTCKAAVARMPRRPSSLGLQLRQQSERLRRARSSAYSSCGLASGWRFGRVSLGCQLASN
uniref:Ig-like domain-containing protein n=1 Tax=Macrostomum lignano TaxID=282301 RepID=A0A1I8FGE5_9PLAT